MAESKIKFSNVVNETINLEESAFININSTISCTRSSGGVKALRLGIRIKALTTTWTGAICSLPTGFAKSVAPNVDCNAILTTDGLHHVKFSITRQGTIEMRSMESSINNEMLDCIVTYI